MFTFDFDIEDVEDTNPDVKMSVPSSRAVSASIAVTAEPFRELTLADLLDRLPSQISYSPLSIPLSSSRKLTLTRRDLFDARFQLISRGGDEDATEERQRDKNTPYGTSSDSMSALDFFDSPSDLVSGVYEGGLKTWECSLDLVDYLDGIKDKPGYERPEGKRILEIGCGTAVPSLYLLREIFSSFPLPEGRQAKETHIHVQDYNTSVLELITLPNILLTWYMSPSSAAYRYAENNGPSESNTVEPLSPGELSITPELKAAFLSSLHAHGIALRFFAGSWDTFDLDCAGGKYDIVLTSETIYRTESLPSLMALLRAACGCGEAVSLEQLASSHLSISSTSASPLPTYLCLVAAKVLYFGVGGGMSEFVRAIENSESPGGTAKSGKAETVWERKVGVGRKVIRVEWPEHYTRT